MHCASKLPHGYLIMSFYDYTACYFFYSPLFLPICLLQRKSEGEHESSRRLKTQFLIEMEGFDSGNEQVLLIGNC